MVVATSAYSNCTEVTADSQQWTQSNSKRVYSV